MAKAETIKLSNSEIAARLIGFHARYSEECTFAPGDVVKQSLGIRPSLQQFPDVLSRFGIVLQVVPSLRKFLNNTGVCDSAGLFIVYMDSDGDACAGWAEAWRYELVTPADYRSEALHG